MEENKTEKLDKVIVIDTGKDYYLQTEKTIRDQKKQQLKLEYGSFLLCLSNIDMAKLSENIKLISKQFSDKVHSLYQSYNGVTIGLLPKKSEVKMQKALFSIISVYRTTFYKAVLNCIRDYQLNQIDSDYITSLIVNECVDLTMISLNSFDNNNVLPQILEQANSNVMVSSILFKKSASITDEINDLLFNIKLESTVQLVENNTPFSIYYIRNLTELFVLDTMNYIRTQMKAKKCPICKKNFFTKNRSDEIYCSYPNKNGKTCKQKSLKYRLDKNPYEDTKYKARKEIQTSLSRIYDEDTAKELYKVWSKEVSAKAKEFKAKDDLKGFTTWLDKNKPTKK